MKKIQLLIVMMLAALAGACRSDLAEPVSVDDVQATILTATIESSSETRTFLSPPEDGVSRVCWSDGDGIGVFVDGSSSPSGFALTAGTGTRNGTFSGAVQGKNYVAVYPYSRDAVLDGQNVRIELPAEQDYVPSSFGNGAYPMVAVSSSSESSFTAPFAPTPISGFTITG